MRVDLFDYDLPPDLIAQHPFEPRDSARLLHVTADGLADRHVRDLPDLLRPGDLLVLNDTKVLPTRFFARRGEVPVEITLVERAGPAAWFAYAKPGKRLRPGDAVALAEDLAATVLGKDAEGRVRLGFDMAEADLLAAISRRGSMPLPPYIRRKADDAADRADYQTIFARAEGAVAAPTAALHFTPALMAALAARGIGHAFVTLHVGAGTFLPVKVEDTADHRMHAESCELPPATAERIAATRTAGGRIVAVGTTSLRTLESFADGAGGVRPGTTSTKLFITPGWRFSTADLLLTNFHLPRSTLLMLVAAFAGLERIMAAYSHAIRERYRFYSYGDASLLECQ
ncbi:MAG: tRNA preQ1(34) S-adenosylmethionine ribosyltransferase-isomerase QueA [Geminicoccaceae bacterium]